MSNQSLDKTLADFGGKNFSFLKDKLKELLIAKIWPFGQEIKKLLKDELNIEISKTETRSDWSKRPLNLGQIQYALEDVNHLLSLHGVLEKN